MNEAPGGTEGVRILFWRMQEKCYLILVLAQLALCRAESWLASPHYSFVSSIHAPMVFLLPVC